MTRLQTKLINILPLLIIAIVVYIAFSTGFFGLAQIGGVIADAGGL